MSDTFDADGITLHRVREHVWEIPAEGDMRVPARVLASRSLLEQISDDRTLQQLKNATHLPGITTNAICMPDGHQGYGFPVGGVGATDAETGCISPGAIGYDINCLSGDAEVLLSHGRRRRIDDLAETFEDERAMVPADELTASGIRLFTETEGETVYEVRTETGDTVRATADHQFRTPDGMVALEDLDSGDSVLLNPFRGVPDERPEEFTLLTEADFEDESTQLVRALKDRDLLPLKSTDEALAHLLKLVGFHTGDGAFSEAGGHTWFYGDPEDLEAIRRDIDRVGFKPSRISERERSHEIDGNSFDSTEYSTRSTSKAFMRLIQALGAPGGTKVESEFELPWYFDRLAGWQQALYLSAFFGAEMSTPSAMADKNLYCPTVSHNRVTEHGDAGERFLQGIADALDGLGVDTNTVERFETDSNADRDVERLRLGISNDSENLIRFFTTVGYRYNHHKQRLAAKSAQYLKRKESVTDRREGVAEEAAAMADGGAAHTEVNAAVDEVNDRFVERSIWSGRDGRPRPPADFPGFEAFCGDVAVGENMTVETEVASIERAGSETVYDIGVEHDDHSFLANGFAVSNCGVRMLTTNLTYDDLRGREEDLVGALFDGVPSGLGGGGVVETDRDTLEAVLERGVEWAVDEGYGVEEDLLHCEDEGRRPDADPSKVSRKAKDRGKNQLGSLGSGNHFLEVQRVTDVFLEDAAEAYGLEEGQAVVLVHCGSRGLGHQICNDYLREIEQRHQGLLDRLPDKELAAAPADSQLADDYYGAMCAAINFAWVNRQLITHQVRQVFADVFDRPWQAMGMDLLYDVAHNIGKKEVHEVGVDDGGVAVPHEDAVDTEERELYVHRKGATRAFPAGHPEIPEVHQHVGQPIIIPGSMGAGSYVLRGGERSMQLTFGSTAHGAGRTMSRTEAKDTYWGGDVQDELRDQQHVYVKANSGATVAEEAPGVYKDVDEVVRVSDELGIGDKVARTYPVCNIKG